MQSRAVEITIGVHQRDYHDDGYELSHDMTVHSIITHRSQCFAGCACGTGSDLKR